MFLIPTILNGLAFDSSRTSLCELSSTLTATPAGCAAFSFAPNRMPSASAPEVFFTTTVREKQAEKKGNNRPLVSVSLSTNFKAKTWNSAVQKRKPFNLS